MDNREIMRDRCWYCGGQLIWGADFNYDEVFDIFDGMEYGGGVVSNLTCSCCGAEVQYSIYNDDEGNLDPEKAEAVEGYKSDKVQRHLMVLMQLHGTFMKKNADYGDSFSKLRDKYDQAIMIRLWDKINRLDQLIKGADQKVVEESIEDTLLDLANYAIMEVVERRIKGEPERV